MPSHPRKFLFCSLLCLILSGCSFNSSNGDGSEKIKFDILSIFNRNDTPVPGTVPITEETTQDDKDDQHATNAPGTTPGNTDSAQTDNTKVTEEKAETIVQQFCPVEAQECIERITTGINQNDGDILFEIAESFYHGDQLKQSLKNAGQWYAKTREAYLSKGDNIDAEGCYHLGYIYANGLGGNVDNAQAFQWITKAAERGSASGMFELSQMYLEGLGTTRHFGAAKEWIIKAAQKNNVEAMYQVWERRFLNSDSAHNANLQALKKLESEARHHPDQLDVSAMFAFWKLTESPVWRRAIKQKLMRQIKKGDPEAQRVVALYPSWFIDEVRQNLFPEINPEDYSRFQQSFDHNLFQVTWTEYWLERSAKQNHIKALKNLKKFYQPPYAAPIQDNTPHFEAYYNVLKSLAQLDNTKAQYELGLFYTQEHRYKNIKAAFDWLKKASEKHDPFAMYIYAQNLLSGAHIEKNEPLASAIFKELASILPAMLRDADEYATNELDRYQLAILLAKLYIYGQGVPPNPDEGYKIIQKYAEINSIEAGNQCINLGHQYLSGSAVPQDLKYAEKYAMLADSLLSRLNNDDMMHKIDMLHWMINGDRIPENIITRINRRICNCHEPTLQWLEENAKANNSKAIQMLGDIYVFCTQDEPLFYRKDCVPRIRLASEEWRTDSSLSLKSIYAIKVLNYTFPEGDNNINKFRFSDFILKRNVDNLGKCFQNSHFPDHSVALDIQMTINKNQSARGGVKVRSELPESQNTCLTQAIERWDFFFENDLPKTYHFILEINMMDKNEVKSSRQIGLRPSDHDLGLLQ